MTKKYNAILDAALEAFALSGFDGASLRDIAKIAGVAQPTINYHFKSKNALFEAIVDRGAKQSTELRMRILAQARENQDKLTLEAIMRILLETYNLPPDQIPQNERLFNKFIARFGYGDSDAARAVVLRAFDDMAIAFVDAIMALDVGFERPAAMRAYLYALPTGIHAIDHRHRIPKLLGTSKQAPEAQHSFDEIIVFICAGMRTMANSPR
jgi:AcrR family transcriptional regulator